MRAAPPIQAPRTQVRGAQAALLLALLVVGCRSGEAASHNLDVLMSSEERLRYVGDLRSPLQQLLRGFVDPALLEEGSWLALDEEEPIKDPTDVVVENLLALARSGDGPAAWREAEEVRHFARYAVACPAGLARERALLALGAHGRRLGLAAPPAPGQAANAEELRVRLEGLVDGARALLAGGEDRETAMVDFEAACRVLAAADVDVAGGRRVLRAVSPFLRLPRLPERAAAALVELSEALQARLVGEALARGLRDELPYVRAAAVRANTEAYGDRFLLEAVFALGAAPVQPRLPDGIGAAHSVFGLAPDELDVPDARVEVCRLLVERGVPAQVSGSDGEALTLRFGMLFALMQVATGYDAFHPRARAHAMLALEAVTDAGVGGLREEVWYTWWQEVGPGLERAAREARAAAGGAPQG